MHQIDPEGFFFNNTQMIYRGTFYYLLIFCLALPQILFSQRVDYIYSNFNGYWNSGMMNTTPINNDCELLGFRFNNGTTTRVYSTGVNNNLLTANGVTFQNTRFRSLPIKDVKFPGNVAGEPTSGSGGPFLFAFASGIDGNINQALNPPFSFPDYRISIALNRGAKGMGLGSALTNVPSSTPLEFTLQYPMDPTKINDGVPDMFFTQQADAGTNSFDEVWYEDASGNMVGNAVTINFASAAQNPVLGKWNMDFYEIKQNTPLWNTNGVRDIRLFAVDIGSFGINTTNYPNVKTFKYRFNGQSDPGILAYNEETFNFFLANDDSATANPSTSVTIPVLNNDLYNSANPITLSIFRAPYEGTAVISGNNIIFTAAPSTQTNNIVTFEYQICDANQCDNAVVTITIPGGYCTKPFNSAVSTITTKIGINTQASSSSAWPLNVPNGFIALESQNKGFVLTRTTSSAIPTADLTDGMIIYDNTDKCIKLYNGSAWRCVQRICID